MAEQHSQSHTIESMDGTQEQSCPSFQCPVDPSWRTWSRESCCGAVVLPQPAPAPQREGEPAPDTGQCWARCGARSVPGDGSDKVGATGVPAPSRQKGHALIAGPGSRSRHLRKKQGSWRPVESRKCQGKAGQEQEPRSEQVERDVAGAGMGPGHVSCTAESSLRLLLWARCHGQAGRAEGRRSLGDARV